MVNASCVLPPEYRNGDLLRCRAVKDGVIEFEIVRLAALPSDENPPNARRDSIIAYLRRRASRWQAMADHFQATGEHHVAERFGGAARLTADAIQDIMADVDLMPAEPTS